MTCGRLFTLRPDHVQLCVLSAALCHHTRSCCAVTCCAGTQSLLQQAKSGPCRAMSCFGAPSHLRYSAPLHACRRCSRPRRASPSPRAGARGARRWRGPSRPWCTWAVVVGGGMSGWVAFLSMALLGWVCGCVWRLHEAFRAFTMWVAGRWIELVWASSNGPFLFWCPCLTLLPTPHHALHPRS